MKVECTNIINPHSGQDIDKSDIEEYVSKRFNFKINNP